MQKTGVKTERMQEHPSDTLLGCPAFFGRIALRDI